MRFPFIFLLSSSLGWALPHNPEVIHGDVSLSVQSPEVLEVISSDGGIIHWEDFSISKSEITQFLLPDESSKVLNRVTGDLPSQLDGLLSSNGQVFLINPQGIIVGNEGRVDTASFIASCLDVSNEQFLANGDLLFHGDSKGVLINLGTIQGRSGDVLLIGRFVENRGQIEGAMGGLAAAGEVLIKPDGQERIYLKPSVDEAKAVNGGVIAAMQVEVKASANPYALSIQHEGIIEAKGVEEREGRVFLVAQSGKVEVSGKVSGDTVQILGDHVGLRSTAMIDASGDNGGGEILVGGSYKGKDRDLVHAKSTFLEPGAQLIADAKESGDGGTVIVWADEQNSFWGEIIARGGRLGGDGGFAEVSSRNQMQFEGKLDLTAPQGSAGTILLDPQFIVVATTGGVIAGDIDFADPPNPGTTTITGASLGALLAANNVTLQANTDITINDTVAVPHPGMNLTLEAGRSIIFASAAAPNPAGTITWNNGSTGGLSATINDINAEPAFRIAGEAMFFMNPGTSITTNTAPCDITITQTNQDGTGIAWVELDNGSIDSNEGSISIEVGTGGAARGTNNYGIYLTNTSSLECIDDGSITLSATGGTGGNLNVGVQIDPGPNFLTTETGDINITGTGGGTLGGNYGIYIDSSNVSCTLGGSIILNGTGGDGIDNNHGVFLDTAAILNANTVSPTPIGSIQITGNANGTGDNNIGIECQAMQVNSNTGASITFMGTGSLTGVNDNFGVDLEGAGLISSNGDIMIQGLGGGNGTGTGNTGVNAGASVEATMAGTLTLTGIAGNSTTNNVGLEALNLAQITAVDGALQLNGAGNSPGTENYGIWISNADVAATGLGSVTFMGGGGGRNGYELWGVSRSLFECQLEFRPFADRRVCHGHRG